MSAGKVHYEKSPTGRIEHALFSAARNSPTATAVIAGRETLDFETLADRASGFAQSLRDHELQPGDRVALFQDKTFDAVVALYGTWIAGGIAIPIHAGLRRAQLLHILETASCRFIVSDARRRSVLQIDDRPETQRLTVGSRTSSTSAKAPIFELDGGDTPASIMFTSGSTGRPKGILLSHNNLRAGTEIVCRYLGLTNEDRILSVLPFSFDYGMNQLLSAVERGATLVLQRSQLPADVCRSLADHEISVLAGVPPFWIQLMSDVSPLAQMDLPALRILTNSGGVFPADLIRRYRARFPKASIFLMYGFSEAFRSTFLPPAEIDRRPDSIGRAIPGCDVFVLDEAGRECDVGVVGELIHRGPTVALGYWNDPETTAKVFRPDPQSPDVPERVAFSGDLVRRDEEGFLYYAGRRDGMIKSMGFRISPEDVEEQIRSLGTLSEVVVGSRPDETAGRRIIAHVVPHDPKHFGVDELIQTCRRHMPAYMVPAEIYVHASLPRTPSGKFDRNRLRA